MPTLEREHPKLIAFWRKMMEENHEDQGWRDGLALCLAEAEAAKRELRKRGYGHIGKGLLDTVGEVPETAAVVLGKAGDDAE